jgi:hypothetical protein
MSDDVSGEFVASIFSCACYQIHAGFLLGIFFSLEAGRDVFF